VTAEQLVKRLELVVSGENKKIDLEVLKRIAAHSEGCVRDAESLLSKILSLGDEISLDQAEIVLPRSDFSLVSDLVFYLAENNAPAAIEAVNRMVDDGIDLIYFTESLMEFLRQMLLVKADNRLESYGIELWLIWRLLDLAVQLKRLSKCWKFSAKARKYIKRSFSCPWRYDIRITQKSLCPSRRHFCFQSDG
jgi:DNA polymerase III gamma/tau subunit